MFGLFLSQFFDNSSEFSIFTQSFFDFKLSISTLCIISVMPFSRVTMTKNTRSKGLYRPLSTSTETCRANTRALYAQKTCARVR